MPMLRFKGYVQMLRYTCPTPPLAAACVRTADRRGMRGAGHGACSTCILHAPAVCMTLQTFRHALVQNPQNHIVLDRIAFQ